MNIRDIMVALDMIQQVKDTTINVSRISQVKYKLSKDLVAKEAIAVDTDTSKFLLDLDGSLETSVIYGMPIHDDELNDMYLDSESVISRLNTLALILNDKCALRPENMFVDRLNFSAPSELNMTLFNSGITVLFKNVDFSQGDNYDLKIEIATPINGMAEKALSLRTNDAQYEHNTLEAKNIGLLALPVETPALDFNVPAGQFIVKQDRTQVDKPYLLTSANEIVSALTESEFETLMLHYGGDFIPYG